MGVVTFKSKLSGLKSDTNFRFDVKYGNFIVLDASKLWNSSNCYELKNVLKPLTSSIVKKGELEEEQYLIDLSNIERKRNNLISLETVTEIGSDKNLIKFGDIVIPKIEPKKGQFFLNLNHNEYIGSTELNEYQINKEEYNPFFLYYLLTTDKFLKILSYLESGKTHKRVSAENLLKIKVPKIKIAIQNELAKQIQPIETEISKLKNSKLKPIDIIDKVFGEEFGFDWEEFERLSREKVYKIKFSKINDTTDFRTATKFHSIKYDFLKLDVFNKHKFKDFAEFMTLGRQIQPEQFEEETDYYYLMPNAIKTNSLNDDLMKEIKFSFFDNLKHIALKYNDLILAASGEGTIGKSAIYNSEKEAITSQFIMKIELKDKSIVEYFHYYMQSSYFLLTVEKFKKGMGNMTNIFVSQVKDFPVLFDETKHTKIVEKIKSQIDAQNIIDSQIEQKQQQINEIIENAIKTE